jgi:cation-transporting P-type ATPase 13A2
MGVIPTEESDFGKMVTDVTELDSRDPFVVGMASCHSLTMIDGHLNGDPLDLKLFQATDWVFCEPRQNEGQGVAFNSLIPTTVYPRSKIVNSLDDCESVDGRAAATQIGIVKQFPFSSG